MMLHEKLSQGDIVYRANWHNVPFKVTLIEYNSNNKHYYITIMRYDGFDNTIRTYREDEFDLLFYQSLKNTLNRL